MAELAEPVPEQTTPTATTPRLRLNRGHYTVYTPEQKAEIGRYAAEHGNLKAVCAKFSEDFGIEVKESTVRQFKKAYFTQLNEGKDPDQITALRGKKRGRPSKAAANSPAKASAGGGVAVSPTVVVAEINGKDSVAGEYEQMVGEMAISTCITVSWVWVEPEFGVGWSVEVYRALACDVSSGHVMSAVRSGQLFGVANLH